MCVHDARRLDEAKSARTFDRRALTMSLPESILSFVLHTFHYHLRFLWKVDRADGLSKLMIFAYMMDYQFGDFLSDVLSKSTHAP